jgi:hypothetical protein
LACWCSVRAGAGHPLEDGLLHLQIRLGRFDAGFGIRFQLQPLELFLVNRVFLDKQDLPGLDQLTILDGRLADDAGSLEAELGFLARPGDALRMLAHLPARHRRHDQAGEDGTGDKTHDPTVSAGGLHIDSFQSVRNSTHASRQNGFLATFPVLFDYTDFGSGVTQQRHDDSTGWRVALWGIGYCTADA